MTTDIDVFGQEFDKSTDEEFEEARQAALRIFKVRLVTGIHETVHAHFHDAGQHAGCLSFVTIDSGGRSLISHVYNSSAWSSVWEQTPESQQRRFENLRKAAGRRRKQSVKGTASYGPQVMH